MKELIEKIMSVTLEKTRVDRPIFFEYSGHVESVNVKVYEGQWNSETNCNPVFSTLCYLDEEPIGQLQKCLEYLEGLK
jgi:hypothetical protein